MSFLNQLLDMQDSNVFRFYTLCFYQQKQMNSTIKILKTFFKDPRNSSSSLLPSVQASNIFRKMILTKICH